MLRLLIIAALIHGFAIGAEKLDRTIPSLVLRDGRTLRNVTIVSYGSSTVMAKWDGGRGTIPHDAFPDEFQAALTQRIPPAVKASVPKASLNAAGVESAQKPTEKAAAVEEGQRILSGQVFVTTRGAGAYRFSNASLVFYPIEYLAEARATKNAILVGNRLWLKEHISAWEKALKDVPVAATSRTDADGNFEVSLPAKRSFFVYCHTFRKLPRDLEINLWVLPVPDGATKLMLTEENQADPSG